ncbi:DUF3987 domain-containing protein [Yinghuangia sp. YIM S10712]|uniref:DUF3987 domain-containing protein n=1 Tax=Yinghuangia sp. YIM S10712 TaxID=3436930 RepID=UPI003F52ABEC
MSDQIDGFLPGNPMYDGVQPDGKPRPDREGPTPSPLVFHGFPGTVVRRIESTTEADPVAILVTLMAAGGVMVGRGPHVRIGDDRHPALIWPLIYGNTSTGRKGSSRSTAMRIVRAADEIFAVRNVVSGLSSGEGLLEELRDQDDDEEGGSGGRDRPDPDDKRRLVVESEYAVTMARGKREGNTLPGMLRQAWDGDHLSVMNRSKLKASDPHVGIVAHITQREFRAKVQDSEMAGGTYNRFLPFYSHRNLMLPHPVGAEEQIVTAYGIKLREHVAAARSVGLVRFSTAASKVYTDELYEALTDDSSAGPVAEFTARAAAYCQRIAMLYALLDHRAQIEEDDLRAAYDLVGYSQDSARHLLLGSGTGDVNLDKLIRAVRDAGPDGLTQTQVTRMFGNRLKAADKNVLVSKLLEMDGYAMLPRPTGGASAKVLVYSDPAN